MPADSSAGEEVCSAAARLFALQAGGDLYGLGMRHVEERFEARARRLLEFCASPAPA